jgi:hypothetical protein
VLWFLFTPNVRGLDSNSTEFPSDNQAKIYMSKGNADAKKGQKLRKSAASRIVSRKAYFF